MSTQNISFWTTGESFTRLVRNFWEEGSVEIAIELLQELDPSVKLEILTGKRKFEGDTRKDDGLLVVEDASENSCKSLQETVEKIEKLYVEEGNNVIDILRRMDLYAKTLSRESSEYNSGKNESFSRENDERLLKPRKERKRKLRSSLLLLYPFLNKTIDDLPEDQIIGNHLEENLVFTKEFEREVQGISSEEAKRIEEDLNCAEKEEVREIFQDTANELRRMKEWLPVDPSTSRSYDGYFLPNGDFYETRREGHIDLEYVLSKLGKVDPRLYDDWNISFDDPGIELVKLSSGNLMGKMIYSIGRTNIEEDQKMTRAQRDAVLAYVLGKENDEHYKMLLNGKDIEEENLAELLMKAEVKEEFTDARKRTTHDI
jgi:hypothetical protein